MPMRTRHAFFGLLLLYTACRNNEHTTEQPLTDTLSYTYDSVKVYSPFRPEKAQVNDSTKAVITFPVFKDDTSNQFIRRQIFDYIAKEEAATSYADIVQSFISGYDDFFRSNPDTFQSWYLTINIEVLQQKPSYLSIKYSHADYAGGAHGNSNITYLNYNPRTHQSVVLDSLIRPGKMGNLIRLAEQIFRKNEKLDPLQSLEENYFFEKGIFSLPPNFYVNDKGLVFSYNPYEIKPYVYGYTELVIPFNDLKDLAKPHTILNPSH